MPTQEQIMHQIVELVSKGAGDSLTGLESALRERYYQWIVEVKKGNSTSPRDIWDTGDGKKMQERFKHIGKRLAKKQKENATLAKSDCVAACSEVEQDAASSCPHCPEPTTGG